MATRYYTEEAYEQIKQTIQQIDNTDVCPVRDFFSALVSRVRQLLKLVSVDNYKEDMQSWYDLVLDSHNTTMSQVDSIFNDVDSVDFEYRDIMGRAVESIVSFRGTLNTLRDVISGKTSLADGKAAANKFLAAGKNELAGAYDTILRKMEKKNAKDAGVELIGDMLKLGAGFAGLLIPATPAKYAVKCKKFVDTFTATLNDFGATATNLSLELIFGVGSWCGMDRKDYLDYRFDQLTQAQKYKDTNSVSDWLGGIAEDMEETLMDCPEDNPYYPIVKVVADHSRMASNVADGVDVVADLYDIVSDVKDSIDDIGELLHGKDYTLDEYAKAFEKESPWKSKYFMDGDNGPMINVRSSPGDIISKLLSDRTGISFSGWKDPSKFNGNIFKTAGTLWSYTETFLPDPAGSKDWLDVFAGKIKEVNTVKDIIDFARDNLIVEVS